MHPVRHPRISSCMHAPWIPLQKVMKHIASSLEDPHDEGVRAAAAKCVLALSRSVQNLRSSVIETEVAVALCRLLKDTSPRVQVICSYRAFALCACAGRQSAPRPFHPPPTTIHPSIPGTDERGWRSLQPRSGLQFCQGSCCLKRGPRVAGVSRTSSNVVQNCMCDPDTKVLYHKSYQIWRAALHPACVDHSVPD